LIARDEYFTNAHRIIPSGKIVGESLLDLLSWTDSPEIQVGEDTGRRWWPNPSDKRSRCSWVSLAITNGACVDEEGVRMMEDA
jgi:hypothetical protein